MLKLRDLDAKLLWKYSPGDGFWTDCKTVQDAQGIEFLCPRCFLANGNSAVGTHGIICWFNDRGIPDDVAPGPGRWNPIGNTIDDLTFVAPGMTSVLLTSGCRWHGFIENGETRTC